MDRHEKAFISVRQFKILIILGVIGDSIHILPTVVVARAKHDSWLSMLLALLLGLLAAGLFAAIANRLRGESPIMVSRKRLGVWGGGVVGLLFLFEFFICSLGLLVELSEFMTTQLMPETPDLAFLLLFTAVIIIAYRYGIEAFARLSELLFPVFLVLFVFLTIAVAPEMDFSNMLPIAGQGVGPIVRGALPAFVFGFTEMIVLLMLVPHVRSDTKLTKPILSGFVYGGIILFIIIILCEAALGTELMETKYYPIFVLGQKISIGHFLERVEAVIAFLWIISVFFKTLLLFFALSRGIKQLFGLKESQMLTIPLGIILMVSSMISNPSTTEYNNIINRYYSWFDLTLCFLFPLVFLVILWITDAWKTRKIT